MENFVRIIMDKQNKLNESLITSVFENVDMFDFLCVGYLCVLIVAFRQTRMFLKSREQFSWPRSI